MGKLDTTSVAGRRVHVEAKFLPLAEMHAAAGEAADTQFGALHVCEQADRTAGGFFQRPHDGNSGGMVVMTAVGKIEAEDIGAGAEKAFDDVCAGAGRTEGCHDFGAPMTAQPMFRGHGASLAVAQAGWHENH